jgi:hypothetical protein
VEAVDRQGVLAQLPARFLALVRVMGAAQATATLVTTLLAAA